jgi:cellobiose phosphorylase
MYRVGIEGILGVTLRRNALHIDPCIPAAWPGFEVTYRKPRVDYRIVVDNAAGVSRGVSRIELDDAVVPDGAVPILDDGRPHVVKVVMGTAKA